MAALHGRRGGASRFACPISISPPEPLSAELQAAILPGREGCWDTRTILSSFRFDRAGRLVFGSVGALRGTGLAVHRAWAKRALAKIFPDIGAVEFEAQWYGMIGMTDNALPRFHRLAPNVVTFCGYNGRGIGPGTVFGRVLADHILGNGERKRPAAAGHRAGRAGAAGAERGLLRGRRPDRPCASARGYEGAANRDLDFTTLSGYGLPSMSDRQLGFASFDARRGSLPHR